MLRHIAALGAAAAAAGPWWPPSRLGGGPLAAGGRLQPSGRSQRAESGETGESSRAEPGWDGSGAERSRVAQIRRLKVDSDRYRPSAGQAAGSQPQEAGTHSPAGPQRPAPADTEKWLTWSIISAVVCHRHLSFLTRAGYL